MAPLSEADKGDFKDKQFAENEIADKVVEQCELKQREQTLESGYKVDSRRSFGCGR
jgi:hypothetical protein